MAYVDPDYRTKRELKEAVLRGREHEPYIPGGMFPAPANGEIVIEGPHYPKPHSWYARVRVKDGIIVKVLP